MKKKKILNIVLLIIFTLVFTGCEDTNTKYEVSNCISCGDTYFPENVAVLSANIINLIKILVPIFIIILGMIEMFKAVISGDDKKMDESKGSLIKKFIAGITIFLVVAIVQFVFGLYNDANEDGSDALECLKYFIVQGEAEGAGVACPDRTQNSQGKKINENNNYKIKLDDGNYSSGGSGNNGNGGDNGGNTTNPTPEIPIEERQDIKNCSDATTESKCTSISNCKWGYDNSSQLHCYYAKSENIKKCGDIGTQKECDKTDGCKWTYSGNYCTTK